MYVDGEVRAFHALDDDWASSFHDSGRHWLRWLRTGEGPLLWSGEDAVAVLRFALAAYASDAAGGAGVDPRPSSDRHAADPDQELGDGSRGVGGRGVAGHAFPGIGVGDQRLVDRAALGRELCG